MVCSGFTSRHPCDQMRVELRAFHMRGTSTTQQLALKNVATVVVATLYIPQSKSEDARQWKTKTIFLLDKCPAHQA